MIIKEWHVIECTAYVPVQHFSVESILACALIKGGFDIISFLCLAN